MTAVSQAPIRTLADLLERLGGVPLYRIWFKPSPGTATEADVVEADVHEDRLCELVHGVLVEKAPGFRECLLANVLTGALHEFVHSRNLGLVSGASGSIRLAPGLVRLPDAAFVSWARVPGGRVPDEPIPDLVPDLSVRVLRADNTPGEMALLRRECFGVGVRQVWEVDARLRILAQYTAHGRQATLSERETLRAGDVLPGFTLFLRGFFAELDRRAP